MKLLPPFKELLPNTYVSDFPSLTDSKGKLCESDAKLLAEYLTSCTVVDEWLSPSVDPLDHTKQVPNRYWTDGKYYWDEMLSHLVKKYQVRLPNDFIEHIKNNISEGVLCKGLDLEELMPEIKQSLIAARKGDVSVYDLS